MHPRASRRASAEGDAKRPDLPRGINDVIAIAMAKAMDDRYPTCGELVRALRAVVQGGLSGAAPAAPTARPGAAATVLEGLPAPHPAPTAAEPAPAQPSHCRRLRRRRAPAGRRAAAAGGAGGEGAVPPATARLLPAPPPRTVAVTRRRVVGAGVVVAALVAAGVVAALLIGRGNSTTAGTATSTPTGTGASTAGSTASSGPAVAIGLRGVVPKTFLEHCKITTPINAAAQTASCIPPQGGTSFWPDSWSVLAVPEHGRRPCGVQLAEDAERHRHELRPLRPHELVGRGRLAPQPRGGRAAEARWAPLLLLPGERRRDRLAAREARRSRITSTWSASRVRRAATTSTCTGGTRSGTTRSGSASPPAAWPACRSQAGATPGVASRSSSLASRCSAGSSPSSSATFSARPSSVAACAAGVQRRRPPAGELEVLERLRAVVAARVQRREHVEVLVAGARVEILEDGGDDSVQLVAAGGRQRREGALLEQPVLERVHELGEAAHLRDHLGAQEHRDLLLELLAAADAREDPAGKLRPTTAATCASRRGPPAGGRCAPSAAPRARAARRVAGVRVSAHVRRRRSRPPSSISARRSSSR